MSWQEVSKGFELPSDGAYSVNFVYFDTSANGYQLAVHILFISTSALEHCDPLRQQQFNSGMPCMHAHEPNVCFRRVAHGQ